MARRRSRLPRNLALFALLAAAGWATWHFAAVRPRAAAGAPAASACRLAPLPQLAERIGRVAVEARTLAPASGVPALSGCEWVYFGGRATGRLFTPDSLAAGGVALDAAAYFRSVATGLEYEFKIAPEAVAGIGDEALAAGFGAGDAPQVVVRRGDRVLALEVRGLERGSALSLAGALAEGL
jgi:hypothetical protein